MDLENLKSELKKRLEYSDSDRDRENEYQKNKLKIEQSYISYVGDGTRRSDKEIEEYEKLKEDKIQDIRKNLNDDESFNNLANKLDEIKAYKEIKKDELKRLDQPNKTTFQKITNMVGRFRKKKGDAESNREKITNEIQDLEKIISDIETLKSIYEKKTQKGGAKTKKTRRNRNSNKSRKNRRKSNCRY